MPEISDPGKGDGKVLHQAALDEGARSLFAPPPEGPPEAEAASRPAQGEPASVRLLQEGPEDTSGVGYVETRPTNLLTARQDTPGTATHREKTEPAIPSEEGQGNAPSASIGEWWKARREGTGSLPRPIFPWPTLRPVSAETDVSYRFDVYGPALENDAPAVREILAHLSSIGVKVLIGALRPGEGLYLHSNDKGVPDSILLPRIVDIGTLTNLAARADFNHARGFPGASGIARNPDLLIQETQFAYRQEKALTEARMLQASDPQAREGYARLIQRLDWAEQGDITALIIEHREFPEAGETKARELPGSKQPIWLTSFVITFKRTWQSNS